MRQDGQITDKEIIFYSILKGLGSDTGTKRVRATGLLPSFTS
jgi:hypothetical protein